MSPRLAFALRFTETRSLPARTDFTWDVTVATSPQQTDPPRVDTPPPPSGYIPIARGVDLQLAGGGLTMVSRLCTNASQDLSHDVFCQGNAGDHPVVALRARISPGSENLLRAGPAAVDVSAASLPTALASAGTHGGWSLSASSCAQCGLLRLDEGLPLTPESAAAAEAPTKAGYNSTDRVQPGLRHPFRPSPAVHHGLRLESDAGGSVTVLNGQLEPTMAATAVEPARQYVLRGFARTNGAGQLRFECRWLTFGGQPTADPLARNHLPMANASWIGFHHGRALWEPLLLRLESPGDAAFVRVGATAADGAVLDLFDLRLS